MDLVLADEQDDLDDAERARLHAAIDRARVQIERGEALGKEAFLPRIHAKR